MTVTNSSSPRIETLWAGALLGGIANAIMTSHNVDFAPFRRWDGRHYFLDGLDGRLGAIAFENGHRSSHGHVVGVFYFSESDYSPWVSEKEYDLERFFHGCPVLQRALAAEGALPFLEVEIDGEVISTVTSAFWDDGDTLAAAMSWNDVIANAGYLIDLELISDQTASHAAWATNYGMSPDQLVLAVRLWHQKIYAPEALISVSRNEQKPLISATRDVRGLCVARQLFKEIGIILE